MNVIVDVRGMNVNMALPTTEPIEFRCTYLAPKAQHSSRAWGSAPGFMEPTRKCQR
jgi:hypothetical protein